MTCGYDDQRCEVGLIIGNFFCSLSIFFSSHLFNPNKSGVEGSVSVQERAGRKWKKQWSDFQAWLPCVKQLVLC